MANSSLRFTTILLLMLCTSLTIGRGDSVPESMSGDSRDAQIEWNEYFHSSTDIFLPGNAYRITFNYHVLSRSENGSFYVLIRDAAAAGSTFGWQEWRGDPGASGTVSTTFVCRDSQKYYLILGIHNQGEISITQLKVAVVPSLKPKAVYLPSPIRAWNSPGNSTYFVDAQSGSDSASGKSASAAWKSLNKINSGVFAPGDTIQFRSGQKWSGYLAPGGSGALGAPITIRSYGAGSQPKIDAHGEWLATLYLSNDSYVTVSGLDIANQGTVPQPQMDGVKVNEIDYGVAKQIELKDLTVHDVSGSDVKADGGGAGIDCVCSGDNVPTKFDGLLIENCHLRHTDRNGITTEGMWSRQNWFPSVNVVIRKNVLQDIGGDGIVPIACDGALVEYNVISGCRTRAEDYCAGIWPWSCDNTTLQYNEVSGMKGTMDGEGYDCDYNCRNTVFQYNLSHNNDGGFMLICDDGGQSMPNNIGNIAPIVRYNISVDDGLHTFHITGPCAGAAIYNNTIYIGKSATDQLVASDSWGGLQIGTTFKNNIFITMKKVGFTAAGAQSFDFESNVFYGDFENHPADLKAITDDPRLRNPGSILPSDYSPLAGSACYGAGLVIPNNGGQDFFGAPIPTISPTIGAVQK